MKILKNINSKNLWFLMGAEELEEEIKNLEELISNNPEAKDFDEANDYLKALNHQLDWVSK